MWAPEGRSITGFLFPIPRQLKIFLRTSVFSLPLALLIPETVLCSAVRADPGDAVAGKAPEILHHAVLADGEAAPALPGKGRHGPAAVAGALPGPSPLIPVGRPAGRFFSHDLYRSPRFASLCFDPVLPAGPGIFRHMRLSAVLAHGGKIMVGSRLLPAWPRTPPETKPVPIVCQPTTSHATDEP